MITPPWRYAMFLLAAAVLPFGKELTARAQTPRPTPPVAVRWWGGETVSIESFWQPPIVIDPTESLDVNASTSEIGLVIPTDGQVDPQIENRRNGRPIALQLFDATGAPQPIDYVYDRLPNQPRNLLAPDDEVEYRTSHEVVIRNRLGMLASSGEDEGTSVFPLQMVVDGVVVVHWGDLGSNMPPKGVLEYVRNADVLLLPIGDEGVSNDSVGRVVEQLNPRFVLPIGARAAGSDDAAEAIAQFVSGAESHLEAVRPQGNTFAVASVPERGATPTKLAVLKDAAWQPSGELAELFNRMEAACEASQKVFAPLSVEKMNFRPSNGTHTPRWNPEHMAGRQLGFFTEIYSALDPAIQPVDRNPAQMPDDYQAAHPTWTGAEEARAMARVSALVRRFAYLLDQVPLDGRAPGSRWTLRGLLVQMDRHFSEHTANVQKKFELPDWPEP